MRVGKDQYVKIEKKNESNVVGKPLIDHARGKVNTISEEGAYQVKDSLQQVGMSCNFIIKVLNKLMQITFFIVFFEIKIYLNWNIIIFI